MKDLKTRAEASGRERRSTGRPIEMREDASTGGLVFDGYAAVFETGYTVYDMFGEYQETVAEGAFTKTLRERADVRLLVNHDGVPLARTKPKTLSLSEDDIGLRAVASVDPANPTVQELQSAMGRGDIDQMSMAFEAVRQEWNADYTERRLLEVKLYDVSVVTFPASETTSANLSAARLLEAIESLQEAPVEQMLSAMRSTRRMPSDRALRTAHAALGQMLHRRDEADSNALIQAVDAAIDQAITAFDGGDEITGKALLTAADTTVDELMELLGIPDPDEGAEPAEPASATGLWLPRMKRELEIIKLKAV